MRKILFIVVLFVFCIGLCVIVNPSPDNDLWARLIAGGYIVENLSILKKDFLSYTPTHPWYDHEWGASVFFYLALKYFGANGLILLKGILSALTLFFSYKTVEVRSNNKTNIHYVIYYIIMFFACYSVLGRIVRCLLFTCLFFAIFLYILERYRYKGGKGLIILPFLMILWCNIHGGCISAFGLLGIYIVGEFLNKKPIKAYIYTTLACLAVLFINPYGFEYVKFLFYAALMDRHYILEWISPFHRIYENNYLPYKYYILFIIGIQIWYHIKNKISYKELDKTKILLIIIMLYLSVMHVRHITFFVFTAGTLSYNEFYFFVNFLIEKIVPDNNNKFKKDVFLLKDIIIYTFIFIVMSAPVFAPNKQVKITETKYPRFAVEFIKINKIKGNLLINFNWGSYAAYKLYPNNLIVMDGRYEEVYNPELLIELKNLFMVKNDWDKILRDYKTDVMILEKRYKIYDKISKDKNWTNIFENNYSGVFVPSDKVKEKYLYPIPDDEYYNSNLFKTDIDYKQIKQ